VKPHSLVLAVVTLAALPARAQRFDLPPLPPPEQYGAVVIDRLSTRAQVKPVLFSHLTHRQRYTCSVCHSELEFAMVAGTTEITEDGNRKGAFCGACHDGKTAFAHTTENCARCHGGDRGAAKRAFPRHCLAIGSTGARRWRWGS
jgi:c(7)-type cytochrome triheme protein